MYQVKLSSFAEKDFAKLPKNYQNRVLSKLILLKETPLLGKDLRGKFKGIRSLRIWPYRIIYEINKSQKLLWIHRIVHRQGAYK